MDQRQAKQLLRKYSEGNCTDQEKSLIEDWYLQLGQDSADISKKELSNIKDQIRRELTAIDQPIKRRLWPLILSASSAAAVLVVLFFHLPTNNDKVVKADLAQNILPGKNRATLTFASGKKVELDTAANGIKLAGGKISYLQTELTATSAEQGMQQLATPRGGQYQIILGDGTRVWLNAATTLSYPTTFAKNQRLVKLDGEAYFEVAHNTKSPFIVETSNQLVKVLGTHFNVNSYRDEPTTETTLSQGSVLVSPKNSSATRSSLKLYPGEQTTVSGTSIGKRNADLAIALAWKNGTMEFKDAPLPVILRQVSRWYGIEIDYSNADLSRKFSGSVSRNAKLASVLKILALSKVPYKLQVTETGSYKLTLEN
ncbi:FecR domain-containing protein [Pedobacter sp. Du54]|uniref:FecR family protein n=1 Tax=Pedobacter anseongensis TaxID=3133439 RepID=UPI0030A5F24E